MGLFVCGHNQIIKGGSGSGTTSQTRYKRVDTLPEKGATNTVYLVPSPNPQEGDEYIEYIWTGDHWEIINSTIDNIIIDGIYWED